MWDKLVVSLLAIAFVLYQEYDTISIQQRKDEMRLLWWFAPFLSGGGYSSEALSFMLALHNRVHLKTSQHGDSIDPMFVRGLPESVQAVYADAYQRPADPRQSIVVCHSEPGAWHPALYQTSLCPPSGATLYKIGRTMFETDRLTIGHAQRCNAMDEIWVPTAFHVETFASSGVDRRKLFVIPEPVDVEFFSPARVVGKALDLPADERDDDDHPNRQLFRFLSIFKWEDRKGWDLLLRAYLTEFSYADNVILYLKTNPYHNTESIQTRIEGFMQEIVPKEKQRARLVVMDEPIPTELLPNLYAAANVFVLPSRGEGWGRPHVEAMSMELPIIATNWSGPTEFMTESNSYPLALDGFSTIEKGPFREHKWANPSVPELQRLMRHVFSHPAEAKEKGKLARKDMVANYAPDVVADIVVKRLGQINLQLDHTPKTA